MGQPTLFGDGDEGPRAPRTPPPERVVLDLIDLGVGEAKARGYGNRQAFAVRDKLRKERKAKKAQADVVAPDPEPVRRAGGGTLPERWAAADYLATVLAEAGVSADDLYVVVRASLYVLTGPELARVGADLVNLLRGAKS